MPVDFSNVVAKVAMKQDALMADRQQAAEAAQAAQAEAQKPRWKFVKTISPFCGVKIAGQEIQWHRPIRHKTNSLAPFGTWETTSLEEAKEMRVVMESEKFIFEQSEPEVLEHEKQLEKEALTASQQENENEQTGQARVQQQVGDSVRDGIQEPAPGSAGEGHQSHQPCEHSEVGTELV
jgi:hypothetical protein